MRECAGPTKNPIPRRKRNVQQGIRIQCSCWYFVLGIKRNRLKLGRFAHSFDEILLKMSLESVLRWQRRRNPQTIYPHVMKKSSPNPVPFSFFPFFPLPGPSRRAYGTLVRETGPGFSCWNRTHGNLHFQLMSLAQLVFLCAERDHNIKRERHNVHYMFLLEPCITVLLFRYIICK